MSGIVFLGTRDLEGIVDFYEREVGADVWLRQEDCVILTHGNILFGFCQRERCDLSGILTFFYPTRSEVDGKYDHFRDRAVDAPTVNERYEIYNFFITDPEGRSVEFQHFLHPHLSYPGGAELLTTRRSVRHFTDQPIPDELLGSVFEDCRFAPTSCNSESYYFIVIRDPETREFLASRRGSSSAPIGRSPIAVAICADPERTRRPEQDGCIGAYHFVLACWARGLGTCWIAAMDRDDVKERLGVPKDHYVATVTPVGFPAEVPSPPARRPASGMVSYH